MAIWLLVGLGNPGPTYAFHRHNIGYLVVDEIADRAGVSFVAPRGIRAQTAETRVSAGGFGAVGDGHRVVLLKSRTFMNESGVAVRQACDYFKIAPDQVAVFHDELDIDPGQLRVKFGGGDNGHNGLKSIRSHLGTGDFYRLRMGIGRPPGRQPASNFVLSPFTSSYSADLGLDISRAADAAEVLMMSGLVAAQNQFNS